MRSSAGFASPAPRNRCDQIHAGQRDVQLGAAGVLEEHVVALGVALRDLAEAEVLRDAVLGVDHVIAGLQVDEVGGEGRHRRLRGGRARHQFGGLEEIFRAEYYKFRFLEGRAVPDVAFDQIDAGDRAGHVGAFGQIRRRGLGLLDAQLVGDGVLVQDVGDALHFTCRRGEERDAIAGFHQLAGLGDGHLHIAVEGHATGASRYGGCGFGRLPTRSPAPSTRGMAHSLA